MAQRVKKYDVADYAGDIDEKYFLDANNTRFRFLF